MYYLCHPNNGQSFQKPSTSTLRSQMAFHFLMFKYKQTSFEEILKTEKDQGKQEKKSQRIMMNWGGGESYKMSLTSVFS